jgi:hypothetical protein
MYNYPGWIYFISEENNNRVKIGYSKDPYKRLKQLQTGNSNKLILLNAIPGSQKEERKWHKLFCHSKINNEWFHLSEEILTFIYR